MIFKEGYTVIYKNGEIYKLGKIAKVIEIVDDFTHEKTYKYQVYCFTGDNTVLVNEEDLRTIKNNYSFLVMKRSAPVKVLTFNGFSDAEQLAGKIFSHILSSNLTKKEYEVSFMNELAVIINNHVPKID